jgi:hypothetical protein
MAESAPIERKPSANPENTINDEIDFEHRLTALIGAKAMKSDALMSKLHRDHSDQKSQRKCG